MNSLGEHVVLEQSNKAVKLSPRVIYHRHRDEIRDIVANDHFGGDQCIDEIVNQWVAVMEPGSTTPLPTNIKGFYGGSLRASIPIEVARGSYKHIVFETTDKAKIRMYARRMLIALSLLDIEVLMEKEPIIAAAALWHKILAEVRLPEHFEELRVSLRQYKTTRPRVNLSDTKMPQPSRLKMRLVSLARELDNQIVLEGLDAWLST